MAAATATTLVETGNTRACLLALLLADPDSSRVALQEISRTESWEAVYQLAETWSVVPQLAQRLRDFPSELQPANYSSLRRVLIETYARSASRAARGAAALRHLLTNGIPVSAFKGVAAMARLYQPQPNRTIKDTDLLVERTDVVRAVNALAHLGFTPADGHEVARLDLFLENSPGFSGNRAIVLRDTTGFEIDLHWSVGIAGLTPSALLSRSETVPLLGATLRVVSVADALVLTVRHAVRENLAVDMICRDLFDVALSCAHLDRERALDTAMEHAASVGSRVPLMTLTAVLCALDATNDPAATALSLLSRRATAAELKATVRLQQLFFRQVADGPLDKDLLYFFHTRPMRQILRGALINWSEYRGFMRSMEETLSGQEIPLSQRLRTLAGTVRGSGPYTLRSLRALARLKHDA